MGVEEKVDGKALFPTSLPMYPTKWLLNFFQYEKGNYALQK